jgi:hypothetical protein
MGRADRLPLRPGALAPWLGAKELALSGMWGVVAGWAGWSEPGQGAAPTTAACVGPLRKMGSDFLPWLRKSRRRRVWKRLVSRS